MLRIPTLIIAAFLLWGCASEARLAKPILPEPPPQPWGVQALAGSDRIALSWESTPGADSYQVRRGNQSGGPYQDIAQIKTAQFVDLEVVVDHTYYYVIAAANPYGHSAPSAEVYAKVSVPVVKEPPPAPSGVTAVAADGMLTVFWNPVSAAAAFRVFRAAGSGSLTQVGETVSTSWVDTGLPNGISFTYGIKAVAVDGRESLMSALVTAAPFAEPIYYEPLPPPVVTAEGRDGAVELAWEPGAGALSYEVFFSPSSATSLTLLADTTQRTFVHSGLENGRTYFYALRSINPAGSSPYSAEVSATPLPLPVAPWIFSANASDATVALAWSPVTWATSYSLWVSNGTMLNFARVTETTEGSYLHTGLNNGTAYRYVVRAKNLRGESPPSFEVHATPAFP